MYQTAQTSRKTGRFVPGPRHSAFVWLICLVLLLGFAFQGSRALWSTDEGRYTDNALQMVDSGNYLVPAYSPDRVNFSKPPMTYWVIAASIKMFGRNSWAVRLPYALAFMLTVGLLYLMGTRLIPDQPWLPGLIYACSFYTFAAANVVSTDVLLTLFETLAVTGFVAAAFGAPDGRRRYLWLMWFGFGLAFLTKGPPGLLPLLAIVPFIYKRDGGKGLARLFSPIGLLIFLCTGLTWYALVVVRHPWVLHYFIHFEIYDRLFTKTQNRHPQWYGWALVYIPVFLIGSFPWWPALWRGMKDVLSVARWRRWWRAPSMACFLALWLLLPLAVFCAAQSRLPLYVLPLFAPLSLLLALKLRGRIDLTRARQGVALAAWVLVLLAIKAAVAWYVHPRADDRMRARSLQRMVAHRPYAALTFVEDTASNVHIEEKTPWGMRMYIRRPLYGVAWRKAGASARLCRVMHAHPWNLVALDPGVPRRALDSVLARCSTRAPEVLGTWRGRTLEMVAGHTRRE